VTLQTHSNDGFHRLHRTPAVNAPGLLLLLLVLSAGVIACFQQGASAADLSELRNRIDGLEQSLKGEEVKYASARAEVLDIERQLHQARTENDALREQLAAKTQRIDDLRAERDEVKQNFERSALAMRTLLVARYKQSRRSRLKVLLNNDDINTIQRNLKYYEYVTAANTSLMSEHMRQLKTLSNVESALKLEALKLRNIRLETETQLNNLKESFESRTRVAKSLESLLKKNKDELKQLHEDENELGDLVEGVLEESAAAVKPASPFGRLKGTLSWPTDGPIAKAPGSAMRDGGAKWSGVIIDSSPGSKVTAIADGRVAFADWFRNLGLLLIIDHGDGYMSLYGHNQEIFKHSGDSVNAGEVVATVGDTGGRSTTGLYFEIRRHGTPDDPRLWCKK